MSMKFSFFTDVQGKFQHRRSDEANVKDIVFTPASHRSEMRQKSFLEQFVGKYRFMETHTLEIVLKDEFLTIAMMGRRKWNWSLTMGTQFKVKGAPASVEFKIKDGKVTGADLLQGGATFEAEKIA